MSRDPADFVFVALPGRDRTQSQRVECPAPTAALGRATVPMSPSREVRKVVFASTVNQVVVVGAGIAGLRVIEQLRHRGYDGSITLVGEEPHQPYDRPPLSKDILWADEQPSPRLLSRVDLAAGLGVNLMLSTRALTVDTERRELTLHGADRVPYDALVLTTGSSPRTLPGQRDYENLHVLRTFDDATRLHDGLRSARTLAVIGGGFIGCEVAAGAIRAGARVTLVEPQQVPMLRGLGPIPGAHMARLHAAAGVDLRTGIGVTTLHGDDRVDRVELSDGTHIVADRVVLGLGAVPNVAIAAGSGIAVAKGIRCDQYGRTTAPGVWAAGDAAEWYEPRTGTSATSEHWSAAHEQGLLVADNILAGEGAMKPHTAIAYFWSSQGPHHIQVLGHPRAEAEPIALHFDGAKPGAMYLYENDQTLTGAVSISAAGRLMRLRPLVESGASVTDARALVS